MRIYWNRACKWRTLFFHHIHFCSRLFKAIEAEMPQIMFHITNRTNVVATRLLPAWANFATFAKQIQPPLQPFNETASGCQHNKQWLQKVYRKNTYLQTLKQTTERNTEKGDARIIPPRALILKCVWQNDNQCLDPVPTPKGLSPLIAQAGRLVTGNWWMVPAAWCLAAACVCFTVYWFHFACQVLPPSTKRLICK